MACTPLRCVAPIVAAVFVAAPATLCAQADEAPKKVLTTAFFDSEDPVAVTLLINLKRIRGDKQPDAPWRSATLSYTEADGRPVTIPIKARTRGIWRLKNCEFPPLRLNLPEKATKGTTFEGLDKPKLVSFCKNDDTFEQYVLQELQVYRAYSLLTAASHKARLLRVTYADSATGKPMTTRYAIMLEEPDALAARFQGGIIEEMGARARDLDREHSLLAGLFEYFIANTDFSVAGLHNFELISRVDGLVIPVAYDFDFSGAINASYATVDPQFPVRHVRDRLFRGYCGSQEEYAKTFALFREKKDAIYELYRDKIGQLLNRKVADETIRFYSEFYRTIDDPRRARRDILGSCSG